MDLMNFEFEDRAIRIVADENGEPLWVAKDVAEALGYTWKGISGTIPHVPEEWRGVHSVQTLRGDAQNMAVLTEQGLYFFLGRSDKPAALPFQKWIAGEVLPSIRKTGSYSKEPNFLAMEPRQLLGMASALEDQADALRDIAKGLIRLRKATQGYADSFSGQVRPEESAIRRNRATSASQLEQRVAAWVQEFVLPDDSGICTTTTKAVIEGLGLKHTRSNEVKVGNALRDMGFERTRCLEHGVRQHLYMREKTIA